MTNDRVSTRLNTLRSLHNALVTNGTIPSNIGDMLRNQLPSESHVDLVKNAAMRDAQMANENAPMPWANSILGSAAYAVASLPVHVAQKVSELLASKDPHEVAAGVKFLDDTAQKHYQNVEDDATGVASLDPVASDKLIELARKYTSLNNPQDQTLGETVGDIGLGFVPGIGQAQAARDFERSRRDNDWLGMGLSAAGVLPIVGGIPEAINKGRKVTKAAKLAEQLENFAPHETAQFKAWSNNNPLITSEIANTYQFKTGEPVVLEAFHGAKRPDRIGDTFLAKRATSGPMAFHTSDPELASGYALGKSDTSISYDDLNYDNWFKIPVEGRRNPVNLNEAWHSFTPEQKQTISQLAPRVGFSDDGEHIILHPEGHASGIGNYDSEIKQTQTAYNRQGNPLKALTESWLTSGGLYNNEDRFMEVLKKAGVPTDKVIFNDPHAEMPAVYKNYIKMDKPLVTSDIPPDVVDALNEAAKKDRSKQILQTGADPWDKRTRTLRDWVDAFNTAKPEDRAYVWTSIPDKVTDVFRSKGYDGIIDYSGKNGLSASKPVYIPFGEYQLKSAIGNKGKFDPAKKSLILGLAAPVAGVVLPFASELSAQQESDQQQ